MFKASALHLEQMQNGKTGDVILTVINCVLVIKKYITKTNANVTYMWCAFYFHHILVSQTLQYLDGII